MARKIIQDVLIRRREPKKEAQKKEEKAGPARETMVRKRGFLKKLFWACVVLAVIFLGRTILVNFSSATIKITPHQEFINITTELKAARGATGNLNLEITQLEREESQIGQATELVSDGQKARGQIVIYNTYSSNSQRLITETRFETPDGKIYKIQGPVVVPGNGSIEIMVYADEPGPEYNIGLTDFTIPGFKGTPRYEKIYGRSKTEMKGGTNENSFVISEKDIAAVKNDLKEKIENYLREKISQQKPDEYLLYKNALEIDFNDGSSSPKVGDVADLPGGGFNFKEKGKATGFLLRKNDLSSALTDKYFSASTSTENKKISVVNLDQLDFSLLSKNADETEITFTLKGQGHFVWGVDTNSLASFLIGVKDNPPAGGYKDVFKNYPEIERAEIIFKPAWWNWMPSDKSRIHFETVLLNQ